MNPRDFARSRKFQLKLSFCTNLPRVHEAVIIVDASDTDSVGVSFCFASTDRQHASHEIPDTPQAQSQTGKELLHVVSGGSLDVTPARMAGVHKIFCRQKSHYPTLHLLGAKHGSHYEETSCLAVKTLQRGFHGTDIDFRDAGAEPGFMELPLASYRLSTFHCQTIPRHAPGSLIEQIIHCGQDDKVSHMTQERGYYHRTLRRGEA